MNATRLRLLGIGMGPQHVTAEVAEAVRAVDYVIALDKSATPGAHAGAGTDEQLMVRRAVAEAHGCEVVVVPDPPRDRDDPADYEKAVRDWHAARAERIAAVLRKRGGTAAMLVWGDPSLYDSAIRLAEQVADVMPLEWDVLPGISAPQMLAAAHRIVLHRIGEPVHITPARRLDEALASGECNIAVMLPSARTFDVLERTLQERGDLAQWQIWWSANLGATGERHVAGRVGDVLADVRAAREDARQEAGWVMDIFLLRLVER